MRDHSNYYKARPQGSGEPEAVPTEAIRLDWGVIRRCVETIKPTLIESLEACNLLTDWLIAQRSGCIMWPRARIRRRGTLAAQP